jgi:hypothetical protein
MSPTTTSGFSKWFFGGFWSDQKPL